MYLSVVYLMIVDNHAVLIVITMVQYDIYGLHWSALRIY